MICDGFFGKKLSGLDLSCLELPWVLMTRVSREGRSLVFVLMHNVERI